jgi:putative oxidoreductase
MAMVGEMGAMETVDLRANALDRSLAPVFAAVQRVAGPALRYSLGLVLLWIGLLKFHDPAPVEGLIRASFPALASGGFVYALGILEVIAALVLFSGRGARYVGLVVLLLFVGTLAIFLKAPAVTYGDAGFPYLALPGQFLLKDLVLAAASLAIVALDGVKRAAN